MTWFDRLAPVIAAAAAVGCAALPVRRVLPPAPDPIAEPFLEVSYDGGLLERETVLLDELEVLFVTDPALAAHTPANPSAFPPGVNPADFDITLHYNQDVQYWIDYFTVRQRDRFALFLTRQGRYEDMIRDRLRARGMPEDLLYLALIESGFSPRAYSVAHAAGIWQFIAETGRRFGLEVSHFVDDRRDPVKSTEAALDYLEELYRRFGSWYLAAAAYNTGENRVERILRERVGGARGEDAIFWQIQRYLPAETRNYVPMMLAAGILSRYRDLYGFNVEPESPEAFDVVIVPDATDLDVVAEAAGTTRAEIDQLNPHFVRGMTPPNRQTEVRIPAGRAEPFAAAYALIPPERRIRMVQHTVRRGETLSALAAAYGSTVAAIQAANEIRNPNAIAVGRILTIPRSPAATPAAARVAAAVPAPSRPAPAPEPTAIAATRTVPTQGTVPATHRVRSGDTLWGIANRYGVTVGDLRAWNNLGSSSTIRPGQELRVVRGGPAAATMLTHRVQPGDTLWEIARRHGVTTTDLIAWNNLPPNGVIRPGDQLRVGITN